MQKALERTEMLIGKEAVEKLKNAKVAVFGLGGVGGACTEALARSGIGELHLIDNDTVSESNLNRQIFATVEMVGKLKTEAAKARISAVAPNVKVKLFNMFYLPENADSFDFSEYDYVVDAIDTVSAKISIICECEKAGTRVISSMGTGNKLDPTQFEVSDIYKTSVCPLARVMRNELKKRNVKSLKVVYSKEEPVKICTEACSKTERRVPASISFVPPAAGLILASEVVKDLIKEQV